MASLTVGVAVFDCDGTTVRCTFNGSPGGEVAVADVSLSESGASMSFAFPANVAVQRDFMEAPVLYESLGVSLNLAEWEALLSQASEPEPEVVVAPEPEVVVAPKAEAPRSSQKRR